MTFQNFTFDIDADGIALVTWNMPGRSMNVIDEKVTEELAAIAERVATEDAIKGAVLTSGKDAFCGGADLTMLETLSRTFAELDGLEIHALAVDSKDQVYAATDPDGKIYKIVSNGKPQLFYDPHQKYIWALAFNSKGDLFVATGFNSVGMSFPAESEGA